ncbi:MAG TPA: glutathione S-transferase [Alphaproteobacteria bacterium]|nr:glutathione S-transferase [Alphaproteobacteria bacterium]
MKLFYAAASPFVRMVWVTALELGIADRIERIDGGTTPMDANPALAEANPVAKLPTLVTDDGEALYDSRVICEYLIVEAGNDTMLPAKGWEHWSALRRLALANGILDAAVLRRYEAAMRPAEKQWEGWSEGQRLKVVRALDELEREVDQLGGGATLGAIAVACALGYLDFRFGHENWRDSRPKLAAWYEDWAKRPSMTETVPAG